MWYNFLKIEGLLSMAECQIMDTIIYYRQQGQGDPLVLLHSGLGTGGDFSSIVPDLVYHYTVFTPDRPGYGRSGHDVSFEDGFFSAQAGVLVEFLRSIDRGPAFLWGWSDGAVVALWMAILYPEWVRAVVVEAGHLYGRKPAHAFLEQYLLPASLSVEERTGLAQRHGEEYWPELSKRWAEMWLHLSDRGGDLYKGQLTKVRTPTLILLAEDDLHIPAQEARDLAARIRGARLHLFPNGGHILHGGTAREQCLASVLDFLQPLSSRQGAPS
jgi:pimeloyl-ACP methyl ester carboxylesterase